MVYTFGIYHRAIIISLDFSVEKFTSKPYPVIGTGWTCMVISQPAVAIWATKIE